MSFLTPGFALAGLLAIAIPIAIHLLNRRRFKVQNWAAMQFLLAAMRKNRRRLQFESWLLLACRCALFALLGLALARPMACEDSSLARLAGQSSALHVIVLDNSYSMAYEADRPGAKTNFDQAKKLAKELVGRLSSGGESVVLITAAQPAEAVLAKPTYDLSAVEAAIDRVPQKLTATDLAGALDLAEAAGREEATRPAKILHVLSDASTSAWHNGSESRLADLGPKLSQQFRVRHYNLAAPTPINAAITAVVPTSNLVRTQFANDFRATARAYGAQVESTLLWKIGDESLPATSAKALTPQSEPVTESVTQLRAGGPTVVSVQLSAADRLPVDNTRYQTIDVANELKILIVEGRRGMGALDGSGAFLELALAPPAPSASPGRATSSYIKPERISDIELSGKVLGDYRAILLTDVAQLAAPLADQLAAYVKQGGTVCFFMGEQVSADAYNNVLQPRGLIPGGLTQRQSSGPGFNFDFNPAGNNSPLLNAFARNENSGLQSAQIFTYWQLALKDQFKAERVLGFKGNADPAITLHTLGNGRVVFFATTADAEWTSFPAKPAYVALMHEIIASTVAGSERWMNLSVGQSIDIPAGTRLTAPPTLRNPLTQTETPLAPVTSPDGSLTYKSAPIDAPGVWTVTSGQAVFPVSVNVPAEEADLRPLAPDALRAALGNIDLQTLGDTLPAESVAGEETGNDFGWSIMLIVFALLGFEAFMAMKFGHYQKAAAA